MAAANNEFDAAKFQQFFEFMMQQMSYQQQQPQQEQNFALTDIPTTSQNVETASVTSTVSKSSAAFHDNQELKTKVVFFNLKEPYGSPKDRQTTDLQNVQEILKVMQVSPKIVKVIRLGKFTTHNKPRRVLVQLSTEDEQKSVLQGASKMKKDSKWKGVSMQPFRPKEIISEIKTTPNETTTVTEQLPELPKTTKKSKKPKPEVLSNPFVHFASNDSPSTKTDKKEINILVIGETGVGKSTWINGIANYMSFNTFDDALTAKKPVCLIPMNFNLYVGEKYEKVNVNMKPTIGERDENEAESSTGQSCTQEPKVYRYITDTVAFNLIDTPGIGDTRGIEYDIENMKMVLKCLSKWENIHGICVLLKPNVPRLTLSLRYCIEELLVNLHKSSIPNISVVFTNSCSTLFKPADTMTVLKKLVDNVKEANGNVIPLTGANTFCIDNEAVRLLYARHKCVEFEKSHITYSSKSWIRTVDETYRFFEYAAGLRPHFANETKATTHIREIIVELTKIMAELNEDIKQNTKAFEQQNQQLKKLKIKLAEKQKPSTFKAHFIQKIPLHYPVTVCCGPNCIETVRIPGSAKQETFYKNICCQQCPLRNVTHSQIGEPNLRQCTTFESNGFCQGCGCSWQTHMHIWYSQQKTVGTFSSTDNQDDINHITLQISAKTNYILQQKVNLHHLQQRYNQVSATCQPFFEYLRHNSIIALNNAMEEYLEFSIEECEKTSKAEDSRNKLENLHKLLAIHQQQKLLANCDDKLTIRAANSSSQKITATNYVDKILCLNNHEIIGPKLEKSNFFEEIFVTSEFKVVEVTSKIELNNNVLDKNGESERLPKKKKEKLTK